MNYNIYSYFDRFCAPKRINQLYFRDKSKNGWPGDILIECEDNSTVYLPRNKRTAVKEYFTPERCLYCLDKLNQFADISLGDNYTGKDEVQYGSNSVIVRTEKGSYHFHKAIDDDIIDAFEANVSDIVISQKINNRIDNLKNQNSKESVFLIRNPEFVSCKGNVKNAKYDRLLSMLKLGSSADFEAIDQEVKKSIKKRNNLANRMKRILRKIKIKLGI